MKKVISDNQFNFQTAPLHQNGGGSDWHFHGGKDLSKMFSSVSTSQNSEYSSYRHPNGTPKLNLELPKNFPMPSQSSHHNGA